MKGKAVAPAAGPKLPANFNEDMAREIAEIQKRIGAASGDQIKWTAGVGFTQPDGSTGPDVTCVIVDFVSTNRYFDRPFQEGEPGVPACFAIGLEPSLLAPSDNSPVKQSDTCSGCPQNEFGSAQGGTAKGKACRNYRLLAVLPANADGTIVDVEAQSLSLFQVPPTSLKAFDGHVRKLASQGMLPKTAVTRITTDATAKFSNCNFEAVRPLTAAELAAYTAKVEEARTRLNQEPDVSQYQAPQPARRAAPRAQARR